MFTQKGHYRGTSRLKNIENMPASLILDVPKSFTLNCHSWDKLLPSKTSVVCQMAIIQIV